MKRKYLRVFVLSFYLFSLTILSVAQNTNLPYFCGFETSSDTVGWLFKRRSSTECEFVIGQATHRAGKYSLYVSADTGSTAGYTVSTSGYVIVAYRKFTFTQGSYNLLFDFMINGDSIDYRDAMRVAIVPGSTNIIASSNGSDFPAYINSNLFTDNTGRFNFVTTQWKTISGVFNINTAGDYYLVFAFRSRSQSSFNPGPCIDNVQISNVAQPSDCHYQPTSLTFSNDKNLGTILSWTGNAPTYDLMCYQINPPNDTICMVFKNIQGNSYIIPPGTIPFGRYCFKIRSTCTNDTSYWAELDNYWIYDASNNCLDFLNFNTSGVTCTKGTFSNPTRDVGIVDYGYSSINSIHTVHYMQDEYDRLTGYDLKTVPDGAVASVRLNNWIERASPSASIMYTYTVTPDAEILLLRYAAVLQYASFHPSSQQTRIHVEILGSRNTLLSPCTEVDCNAKDIALGNTRGWKTYMPRPADSLQNYNCPIKYLDWQILGINLKPYVGQTVKVKITLYSCVADYHFAYAYFVLECADGSLDGANCRTAPEKFSAPEGFLYKWYLMNDSTKTELSNEKDFIVQENDTNSYCVDVIYPEDRYCSFTLNAYTVPRLPKSMATFTHAPHDCINEVIIDNQSAVYKHYQGQVTLEPRLSIEDYFWDLGPYGTSIQKNPTLIVPNDGDTFTVKLRTIAGGCEDIDTFLVEVPAISETKGFVHSYICEGESVEFNGKIYTHPGVYVDTLLSWTGCDSIRTLNLEVLKPDTIFTVDTVCSDMLPYVFHGAEYYNSGIYSHHQPSSLGCDTLVYICNLRVNNSLQLEVGPLVDDICADQGSFEVPYDLQNGDLSEYKLQFNELALQNGFVNTDIKPIEGGIIKVQMPDSCRPDNRYSVDITFYNRDCGNVVKKLDFTVLYSKDVITQRWNDVLSLKNSKYNGGFTFVKYEWYYNGQLVEGHTQTQFYVEGQDLDFDGEYRMKLTRIDDFVELFTCPFIPQQFSEDRLTEVSTLVLYGPGYEGSNIKALAPRHGYATIYSTTGIAVATVELFVGENSLALSLEKGIYIMKILYDEGDIQIVNIVVQ